MASLLFSLDTLHFVESGPRNSCKGFKLFELYEFVAKI